MSRQVSVLSFLRDTRSYGAFVTKSLVLFIMFLCICSEAHAQRLTAPPVLLGTRVHSKEDPQLNDLVRAQIHDYISEDGSPGVTNDWTVSGKYVEYAIPMKWWYLGRLFSGEPVLGINLRARWDPTSDSNEPLRPWHDGAIRPDREFAQDPSSLRINLNTSVEMRRLPLEPLMHAARQKGVSRPIMRPGGQRDVFWLGEEYCGFDVFEIGLPRQWQTETGAPTDEPHPDVLPRFLTARLFGYPAGAEKYDLEVMCDKVRAIGLFCFTSTDFNSFVTISFGFNSLLLCEAPGFIDHSINKFRSFSTTQDR